MENLNREMGIIKNLPNGNPSIRHEIHWMRLNVDQRLY